MAGHVLCALEGGGYAPPHPSTTSLPPTGAPPPPPRYPPSAIGKARGVRQWYTNNPAKRAPRSVRALPLGLSRLPMWPAVLDGRETATPRTTLLYCGPMNLFPARRRMLRALRANGFPCNTTRVPRAEFVAALFASKFVAAAHGHGWNSHREWEALAAGAVPLVDAHAPLAAAFAGLPAVQVRDWAAVTPAFLAAKWEELQRAAAAGGVAATKAYWPYWLERLTAAQ